MINEIKFENNGKEYSIMENNGKIIFEFDGNCYSFSADHTAQLIELGLSICNILGNSEATVEDAASAYELDRLFPEAECIERTYGGRLFVEDAGENYSTELDPAMFTFIKNGEKKSLTDFSEEYYDG